MGTPFCYKGMVTPFWLRHKIFLGSGINRDQC